MSTKLLNAAIELLAVANMRGDDDLPHPADDDKLWTCRMQEAWCDLSMQVEAINPGLVQKEVESSELQAKMPVYRYK